MLCKEPHKTKTSLIDNLSRNHNLCEKEYKLFVFYCHVRPYVLWSFAKMQIEAQFFSNEQVATKTSFDQTNVEILKAPQSQSVYTFQLNRPKSGLLIAVSAGIGEHILILKNYTLLCEWGPYITNTEFPPHKSYSSSNVGSVGSFCATCLIEYTCSWSFI